ncbi:sulfurtransferase TusA family protein, partial [Acinetobacter baumannii]
IPPGGLIEIIASDPGAPEDFAAFCTAEGHDLVEATAANGRYTALIRRAAGMGDAPTKADPDHFAQASAFCDVLVVGAGPAGLQAALAAAEAGERVTLVEQD